MSTELSEEDLEASLEGYAMQVTQLEAALAVTTEEDTKIELRNLLKDMRELVELTQGSLLSLKKSKLMAMFEAPPNSTPSAVDSPAASEMDREFAAFQMAIGGSSTEESSTSNDTSQPSRPELRGEGEEEEEEEDTAEDEAEDSDPIEDPLDDIIGARCRVSYSHEWGERRNHNAMVVCAEPSDGEPKVRVMFCNPTHRSLVPCPFFLEGRCRFEEDKCRYSHGQVVLADDLEEFKEVDHSLLKLESKCLARYKDGVWYPAMVVDVLDGPAFKVMFDQYDDAEHVDVEDVMPLDDDSGEDGSEDESRGSRLELSDEEDEKDALPVYLWRPNQTTDLMGDWEKHTKGFGSRIMAKMGYVTGQGLGKNSEGRAEPVPIQLLPPGKSLDKIMELKEQAGDKDLYDVTKKDRRKRKGHEGKLSAQYQKTVRRERGTFDFINKKLGGNKKGNLTDLVRAGPRGARVERTTISESDLTKKSDKHINIQLLKTHEETRNVDKEIKRLKESLQRNDGKDRGMAEHARQRIASMETYRSQLQASANSIQRHKQMRSNHKKLTIF